MSAELKPGYKQTEVGVIPEEWCVGEIGDLNPFITSGSRGWADYYSDMGSPFVRITNMSRESIYLDLADLKLVKLPSDVREGTRTHLRNGDVLISITADIGIVGYVEASVPKPAYINQHIALVRFDSTKANARFVSYFLAAENSQKLFRQLTDVGAKTGMNLATIRKIRLAQPSLTEQRAIAGALSDVDALIGALEKLIAKKRDLKQAAMQQLLTGKKRLPGFHGDWEVKRLGDLLVYERPDRYVVQGAEYSHDADMPVLTANKSFVLGYTHESFGIFEDLPVILFDDFTTDSKYVDFPFKVKSSAIKILKKRRDEVDLRYVFERIQLIQFHVGDHKRYYISEYQHIRLPIPKHDEQIAIATVLSDMDAEITALTQRLVKTRALKQGMMQELLTGRTRLV